MLNLNRVSKGWYRYTLTDNRYFEIEAAWRCELDDHSTWQITAYNASGLTIWIDHVNSLKAARSLIETHLNHLKHAV